MQKHLHKKNIIIDLDGTICSEEKTFSRALAIPKKGAAETIKKLKNKGYNIIIYTARSWTEYEITKNWLNKNKINFDELFMGKPIGEYWIDDRAIKFNNWDSVSKKIK